MLLERMCFRFNSVMRVPGKNSVKTDYEHEEIALMKNTMNLQEESVLN